ncbi:MAG: hypothetical protein Q9M23_00615, partial [Mariprofundaceae bacterium]|nr:hypothetical protein [Mariprofundaceae bacterium]
MKLRDSFRQTAKTLIGRESIDFQSEVCPDQHVGSIDDLDLNVNDFLQREPVKRLDNSPSVVLVMKSPHTDEFIGDWGPAKGKTGVQIRRHVATIVAGLGG